VCVCVCTKKKASLYSYCTQMYESTHKKKEQTNTHTHIHTMTKRKREEEASSEEEEEDDFDQDEISEEEEELEDEEMEEIDEDNKAEEITENLTHTIVKKSAQHRNIEEDEDEIMSSLVSGTQSAASRLTDSKNLSSKDKARLRRQQLQDETIDKLLSKAKDKNALNNLSRKRKSHKPYTPYDKDGRPIARYVYSNGGTYMLIPEGVTLFPEKPAHVKRTHKK
jgi:hypothetical protein